MFAKTLRIKTLSVSLALVAGFFITTQGCGGGGKDDSPPENQASRAGAANDGGAPEREAGGEAGAGVGGDGAGTSNSAGQAGNGGQAGNDAGGAGGGGGAGGASNETVSFPTLVAGHAHTCALSDAGKVRCWGWGNSGRLGYGSENTIGDDETPKSVGDVPLSERVQQVVLGRVHTCALLEGGLVRCWGEAGLAGKLGYGDKLTIGDDEPVTTVGTVNIGGKVVQLAAGADHTCALLDNGNVRCWGEADDGRLGYGNLSDIGNNETPNDAGDVAVGGKVTQLTAGIRHTCALLEDGNVRCWGDNSMGQLGYPHKSSFGASDLPKAAGDVDVGGKVIQVTAGGYHTCALLESGSVRCWGSGNGGELGYPGKYKIGALDTPASAGDIDLGGKAAYISAGDFHTCALLESGKVRCWGVGDAGMLGYGNVNDIGDDETPASAGDVDVGAKVSELGVGGQHTCVKLENATIRCWGARSDGVLGYPGLSQNLGDDEAPSTAGNVEVF